MKVKSNSIGQATVEYVLLLMISVSLSILLLSGINTVLRDGLLIFGGQLEKDLKTGRAPLNIWTN